MLTFESYFYTGALSIFAFATFCLTRGRRHLSGIPQFFLAYLFIVSLGYLFELVIHSPAAPMKSLSLGLLMATSYLLGPCLLLCARELVEKRSVSFAELAGRDYAMLAVGAVLALPIISTANFSVHYGSPDREISAQTWRFINASSLLCVLGFSLQFAYYWQRSLKLLSPVTLRAFLSYGSNPRANSLQVLMVVAAAHWLICLLRTVHCNVFGGSNDISLAMSAIDIALAIYALVSVIQFRLTKVASSPSAAEVKMKYAKSSVDVEHQLRIKKKLCEVMVDERLYLDHGLTLSKLSGAVGEKPHYVSQTIGRQMDASFFDFVNAYRIEEAKRLLQIDECLTVVEIADAVGFNSKSTFNSAFRKFTSTTPSAFRVSTAASITASL